MSEKVILLVEDNPDDELLTIRALKKHNILNEIIIVRDGLEALDYVFCRGKFQSRNPEDLPQVVLLDLKLPIVDGLEVLEQIRSNKATKYLPVVILTSSNEDVDIIKGYELGANSYIRKPVDFAEFVESVGRLGLYWLLLNEHPKRKD
jgi:two-component system, response regulator